MLVAWRVAGIVAGFLVCVPLHYFWKLAGVRSPWPRRFLGWAGRRSGLVVTIEGEPVAGPILYAANHVSWLDILALGGAVPVNFVARDDVARWPGIGWAANLNDTIYITRDIRSSVKGQADTLRAALADARAVGLFPEGTTDGGRALLPFRPSLLASLYPPPPGVMVQPVVLDYGGLVEDVLWLGDEPYGGNARRILSRPGRLPVTIRFLDPIDPAEAGDRKALAARAEAAVAASLGVGDPV
jgi:1-acyl-sn-glycerol-3-phosphate acyltransferase